MFFNVFLFSLKGYSETLRPFAEVSMLRVVKNKDVPSENNLHLL